MAEGIAQRSEGWFQERAGILTASRFGDAVAFNSKTGEPTAARTKLMYEKAHERTSGNPMHQVHARALAHGAAMEDEGLEEFQCDTGEIVTKPHFILHPKYKFLGASGDGWIEPKSGVELKCPLSGAIQMETWDNGMPEEHKPQVYGNLLVREADTWWFASYHRDTAPCFRLYKELIARDEEYIDWLLKGLIQFEYELNAKIRVLLSKGGVL